MAKGPAGLRLTGGHAGGRVTRERVPDGVRPTSSRVREALFAMIGQDLEGIRFLDAFGGAGLMALEAWSRGAQVTVVERSRPIAASLRRRAAELGARLDLREGDVLTMALDPVDIVFADPPYALGTTPLEVLWPLAGDILVLEAARDVRIPDRAGELVLDRVRVYGGSQLAVFRRSE
ncbi:MAG: 16S rRNA (guanine(966)-N(2))-methyltransferase RsmD [Deltaproteobacteria bacterium]|nr:MAG: 16S rRNA (guanine(966)-N(2))-methyltransferase RsmD [Deltaproteobacteria bacterium]